MTDAYQRVGYESGRVGLGIRPALLVVDLQLAFTDPRYPLGGLPLIHQAVENTAVLLAEARRRGVPVASCYTAYASEAEMPHWKVEAVRKDFYHGHPCTQLDPRIHDPDYDFSFCKRAASIFFETPLAGYLTERQVDTTIVTGCTTSGCIRASVIDSFSHRFRTIVPAECTGDADEAGHRSNLRDIERRYADVLSLTDVLAYLRGLEPRP